MSRLQKAFLRDPLNGATQVAGFGKHPAWDDHMKEIGIVTETLVLAKQLLYSEGITSQLASGVWDQIEKSDQAIEFGHRFVWSRNDQSIAGAIWASADGKGRTRFPMVICIQAGCGGTEATSLFLAPIDRLSSLCKAAKTQDEVHDSFDQIRTELREIGFHSTTHYPFEREGEPADDKIVPALVTLSIGLKNWRSRSSRNAEHSPRAFFRLPASSNQMKENLEFWSSFLARHRISDLPYLIVAPIERPWTDVIVGEPVSNDFFCLRANESALPITIIKAEGASARKLETEARNFLQMLTIGSGTFRPTRRSWWSRFMSRL